MYALEVETTIFLNREVIKQVVARCLNPFTGATFWGSGGTGYGTTYRLLSTSCPAGKVASGIYGRAGLYVDAIGLRCE